MTGKKLSRYALSHRPDTIGVGRSIVNAIRIRKHIDSDTPYLPELRALIGKTVEIIILDETSNSVFEQLETEETFFGLAPPLPTPEEYRANLEQFRAMRNDPAHAKLWPYIDLVLSGQLEIDGDAVIRARGLTARDPDR